MAGRHDVVHQAVDLPQGAGFVQIGVPNAERHAADAVVMILVVQGQVAAVPQGVQQRGDAAFGNAQMLRQLGQGCNRCRSGCTAPEYPGPGPGNGGHLRKAWVSLPFLIYRASERHSDQVGKTTKVFRCVPHRNPENTGCVRISGYIGTCVPISEQKLCAFWFGRLKTAGRPPFFSAAGAPPIVAFARDADTFGACDGIVGQLNKLQTIKK